MLELLSEHIDFFPLAVIFRYESTDLMLQFSDAFVRFIRFLGHKNTTFSVAFYCINYTIKALKSPVFKPISYLYYKTVFC